LKPPGAALVRTAFKRWPFTRVGLSGQVFIPLLSSFACAIPGIMATRTIANSAIEDRPKRPALKATAM
jgi:Fe2+ transport system protein B